MMVDKVKSALNTISPPQWLLYCTVVAAAKDDDCLQKQLIQHG